MANNSNIAPYMHPSIPSVTTVDEALDAVLDSMDTDTELADHVADPDPHPGYVLESLLDAKGDLYVASANNTPAKQTVGIDDAVLIAAAGETTGVKWAKLETSNFNFDISSQAELDAHINDTSDAHDASAISVLDTGDDFTATDVEGVLAELQADAEADLLDLANHLADTSDSHDASSISILDTANDFTATDVEGALAELQSDAEADATALSDHIADSSAAHAASAISANSATLVGVGTDVQAVLEELDNGIADHLADTSDAHDASAISILDAANDFTATDVEGALAELQSDAEADATALSDHLADTTSVHDHGSLSGNADDDHTQYALLAGRSGGQSLIGGTDSGDDLTLTSTSHATQGTIFADSSIELWHTDQTFTAAPAFIFTDSSLTFNFASVALSPVVAAAGTFILQQSANAFGMGSLFGATLTIKNISSVAANMAGFFVLADIPTFSADTQAITHSGQSDIYSSASFTRTNSGTLAVTSYTQFTATAGLIAPAGVTMTARTGFKYNDTSETVGGTFTQQIGVDVAALSKATTNIGIRNAATTVYTPITQTLTAVGNSIRFDATVVLLDNTSGGSLTLTSAPTIGTGVAGQILILLNVGSQNVVISDQGTLASSNLRLGAATVTLGPRDTIMLMYSTTIGDWIQVARTDVI